MPVTRLLEIMQQAYPDNEVLIRTNTGGQVRIVDPACETVELPARFFVNVYKHRPASLLDRPGYEFSYKAYAPTAERALVLAIRLRDPDLLGSRQYIHTADSKDPA